MTLKLSNGNICKPSSACEKPWTYFGLAWSLLFIFQVTECKGKKKPPLNIFWSTGLFFPLAKLKWNYLTWSKRSSLFQDSRPTLFHLKMLFRLISNIRLYDSQGSLIRKWKMTSKEFLIFNISSSIRVGSSLFYAVQSLVSLQTFSNSSFAFVGRRLNFLAVVDKGIFRYWKLSSRAGFAFILLTTLTYLTSSFHISWLWMIMFALPTTHWSC